MKKVLIDIIIILLLSILIISTHKVIKWKKDINKSKSIKEKINKSINNKIDFSELKKINKDIVGYLKVNGTDIEYVVVKGKDNDFYLHHDINKDINQTGWIFVNYQNKLDGSDKNTVIFGHNMKDGSMFGNMTNILKKQWYENKSNLNITFITELETAHYEIFSIYQIKPEDYYITTYFKNDLEYEQFINTIKKRSIYNSDLQLNKNDKILTLSTCSREGNERIVIHAKKG